MSLETKLSPTLSNLIAEANFTILSVKEKILAAYNYAVENDGYTPIEAAKILKDHLDFSDRYIRQCLPLEAKDTSKTRHDLLPNGDEEPAPHIIDKNGSNVENITTNYNDPLENIPEDREREPIPKIQTAYEIKEAESQTIVDGENSITTTDVPLLPPDLNELETLKQQINAQIQEIARRSSRTYRC